MLAENGLKVAGNHCGYQSLQDETFDQTVEYHQAIGCRYLVVPGLPLEMRDTPDSCKQTADWLTNVAENLRKHGMRTGFHCHSDDMRPLADGVSAWYHIGRNTPRDFIMQYDTSNGMVGGADPVQPLLDFPGRGITLHMKENSAEGVGAVIGEGTVPWDAVLAACEPAGAEWLIVEHETYFGRTPLECVEACLTNLRKLKGG